MELNRKAKQAIKSLVEPDPAFEATSPFARQPIINVIEQLSGAVDDYGVALMMIAYGSADPKSTAVDALAKVQARTVML